MRCELVRTKSEEPFTSRFAPHQFAPHPCSSLQFSSRLASLASGP
jgi:hypothetical protein